MPSPEKKPGVNSLWRTAAICMLAGMAVHWWVASKPPETKEQTLTVRGDPLPPEINYNLQFDHVLHAVDLDNVPLPAALLMIAKQAGINVVLSRDVTDPHNFPYKEIPKITVHLKNVKAGDAFDAAYAFMGMQEPDVRQFWHEHNGLFYTQWYGPEPKRLYTRVYDVKRILERHEKTSSLTTEERSPLTRHIFYDGPANWLEDLIESQTGGLFRSEPAEGETVLVTGESRATFFDNSIIITAPARVHRVTEQILEQLDKQ